MNTQEKPLEQLQAQVAIYANEQLPRDDTTRQAELLHDLGSISLRVPVPEYIEHPFPRDQKEFIDGEIVTTKHKGEPAPLFVKDEYIESLRRSGNREAAQNLGEMIVTYDELADEIATLSIDGLRLEQARLHPNFLANGGSEVAYLVERESDDGTVQKLVVRQGQSTNYPTHTNMEKANSRAIALARGKGVQGLEQGIAVSYDPPLVVSEYAPGSNLYELSPEDRQAIPEEHLQQLKDTFRRASEAGISIDINSDNFIYDPETGFTIIDYRNKPEHMSAEENLDRNMRWYDDLATKITSDQPITKN